MTILTHFLAASAGAVLGVFVMALAGMASERRDVARVKRALWEVIWAISTTDPSFICYRVAAILEEHGIEVPEGEVVW